MTEKQKIVRPPLRTVHCLVCEKKLKVEMFRHDVEGVVNMIPGEEHFSGPDGGLACEATGNFGSTVFDPIGHSSGFLRFYICDDCIVAKKEHVEFVKNTRKVLTVRKTWDPAEDC